MDAMTMYETLGPIKSNGQWSAQLTATSSQEDAQKFRKLYDQQQSAAKSAKPSQKDAPKAEAKDASEAEPPQDGEAQEDPKLQEQMLLAAAAMLQNPVVTQVQDPVEQVVELAAPAAVPVEGVEVQTAVVPVETGEAAEEILPQAEQTAETVEAVQRPAETQEAPEVSQETQKTVETVEAPRAERDDGEGETEQKLEQGGETQVFQDVKAVPVKVGEAPAPEHTQEARPVETQIGEKLTEVLESGETRVEIQLTPENLGKVTIEVTSRQDGTIQVTLHAESSQTRGLLERDLTGLQSALARNTQQEVRVEVQRQEPQKNFYDGQQGHEQRNPQQQQNKDRQSRESTEDFLHQLRLGLVPEGE